MKCTALLILIAALMQGCAATRVERQEAQARPTPAPLIVFRPTWDPLAEQKLKEADELYDRGDYSRVVMLLTTNKDVWNGTVPQRLQAHKLLAFSYCVTRRSAFCEQQFGAALRLDPLFELKLAERNHPQWGPAFEKARGSVLVQVEQAAQIARPASTPSPQPGGSGSNAGVTVNINPSTGVDLQKSIPLH